MCGLLGHVEGDLGRQAPDGSVGHQLGDLRTKPGCWPRLGSPSKKVKPGRDPPWLYLILIGMTVRNTQKGYNGDAGVEGG